jgi:hypothetical protein
MTWIDRAEVRIAKRKDRRTAELRGGEVFRYQAVEAVREPGVTERVCPTLDHLIAAAGW